MKNIDNILDCKQSIFFFRFSADSAHVRERESSGEATTHEKRGRQPNEKKERLPYYRKLTLHEIKVLKIKVLEINAT